MNKTNRTSRAAMLTMLLSIALLSSLPESAHSRLFKWIDESGQVRYSDKLPNEQIRKKHQQINKRGQVIETYEKKKTSTERQQQREKDKKLDILAKQKAAKDKRELILRQIRNRTLLLTFSSEEELQRVHYNKLEVVDSVILLLDKIIAQNQIKLADLEARAQKYFRAKGKEVPGGLAQNIEFYNRKIFTTESHMKIKQTERDKLTAKYEQDLKLYRQLTINKSVPTQ